MRCILRFTSKAVVAWRFRAVEDNCSTMSNSCPQLFMKLAETQRPDSRLQAFYARSLNDKQENTIDALHSKVYWQGWGGLAVPSS